MLIDKLNEDHELKFKSWSSQNSFFFEILLEEPMFPYLSFSNLLHFHRVSVRGHKEEGQIYPPLLLIKYGEVNQQDIDDNVEVPISFQVEYEMENSMSHAIEVSILLKNILMI